MNHNARPKGGRSLVAVLALVAIGVLLWIAEPVPAQGPSHGSSSHDHATDHGPTKAGYGGQGGNVQGDVDGTGGLPLTGLDLGLLAAGGIGIVALGLALRRKGARA